jgi:hypothetical protein
MEASPDMARQRQFDDARQDVLVQEFQYAGARVEVFQHAQSVGSQHPTYYAIFAKPEDNDVMPLVGADLLSVEAAAGAARGHLDTLR